MTNLEFYKDEIYEIQKDLFDKGLCISDSIGVAICNVCKKQTGLSAFMPMVLDWLLEEHKEPIKLKKWEYDLIRTNGSSHNTSFRTFNTYINMKSIGYFDGITNTSMTLKEILENCEVVESL